MDDARDIGLGESDVVEGFVGAGAVPAAPQLRVQHAAAAYVVFAREHSLELRIQLVHSDGRQESQIAQIDGEQRNVAAFERPRRRKQRPVAAQDN